MENERAAPNGDDPPSGSSEALRAEVAEVMARIVAGDRDAPWDLWHLAEPSLARIIRVEARRIDLRLDGDDLVELTIDAALELARLARSWDPAGALPWVWARRRVTAMVHQHAGTFARPLDDEHLEIAQPPPAPRPVPPREALRALAARHPAAHRLERRLAAVASDRDADIYLAVHLEKAAGNRSPAVTIGAEHGLRPTAVRKVVQRIRERIGDVA